MFTRIGLLLSLLAPWSAVGVQESTSRLLSWGVPKEPLNCEMNLQNLEHARDLVRREMNGFLIVVARLGDGERRKDLNYRRLHNVRLQLTLIGAPADKIVVAEGERVKGLGRVEFYVRGEFIGALPVRKAEDICVGCCGPDENFYPYRRGNSKNLKAAGTAGSAREDRGASSGRGRSYTGLKTSRSRPGSRRLSNNRGAPSLRTCRGKGRGRLDPGTVGALVVGARRALRASVESEC